MVIPRCGAVGCCSGVGLTVLRQGLLAAQTAPVALMERNLIIVRPSGETRVRSGDMRRRIGGAADIGLVMRAASQVLAPV